MVGNIFKIGISKYRSWDFTEKNMTPALVAKALCHKKEKVVKKAEEALVSIGVPAVKVLFDSIKQVDEFCIQKIESTISKIADKENFFFWNGGVFIKFLRSAFLSANDDEVEFAKRITQKYLDQITKWLYITKTSGDSFGITAEVLAYLNNPIMIEKILDAYYKNILFHIDIDVTYGNENEDLLSTRGNIIPLSGYTFHENHKSILENVLHKFGAQAIDPILPHIEYLRAETKKLQPSKRYGLPLRNQLISVQHTLFNVISSFPFYATGTVYADKLYKGDKYEKLISAMQLLKLGNEEERKQSVKLLSTFVSKDGGDLSDNIFRFLYQNRSRYTEEFFRWAAEKCIWSMRAIALQVLAETGDNSAENELVKKLSDTNAFVRNEAATILEQTGWKPKNDDEAALYFIANEDWQSCVNLGGESIKHMVKAFLQYDYREKQMEEMLKALAVIGIPDSSLLTKMINLLSDPFQSRSFREFIASQLIQYGQPALEQLTAFQSGYYKRIKDGMVDEAGFLKEDSLLDHVIETISSNNN